MRRSPDTKRGDREGRKEKEEKRRLPREENLDEPISIVVEN